MLDSKMAALVRPHLQPGETLQYFVFAAEASWHWTKLLAIKRFRLLAWTGQRLLVTELSPMGFGHKRTVALIPGQYHCKVEGLVWKENGLTVGQGRLVTLASGDGTRYELRIAQNWKYLEAQRGSFGPLMALLGDPSAAAA